MTEEKKPANLRELLDQAKAQMAQQRGISPEQIKIPAALDELSQLTPEEATRRIQSSVGGGVAVVVAWMVLGALARVIGLAIDRYILKSPSDLAGSRLWTAQSIAAAPYLVFAALGGLMVALQRKLPRPDRWCRAFAILFAGSRLFRFTWFGPAEAVVTSIAARFADAAAVFAAAWAGYLLGRAGPPSAPASFDDSKPIEP
jgi:hypothetical protein